MPEFIDAYGIAIVYDVHTAKTTPRAVVQLVHGLGEHAGRYGALIDGPHRRGFTVYANDHRGHGRTGMAQHGGDAVASWANSAPAGLRAAVAAVWQFTEIIRDENPGTARSCCSDTPGARSSRQMLLNEHPRAYDAVVLTGSALPPARLPATRRPEREVEGAGRHRDRVALVRT